ncbi:MAG: hypothetical protein CSA95_01240 [Bacteroidetes bacterium]|nr:MAG: hypothetical protein CSA95_01240 [Bacteroidota bacterium]PIE88652.1 MAG: hypothetical protein CSA04_00765 [Bacteroidota bacterium]
MATPPNILIVDDQKINVLLLENLLRKVNAKVFKAYDGLEALELMGKNDFALMIFDVQMPEMDGFELANRVRQFNHLKRIPIIFVSAIFTDNDSIAKGYSFGAVDYLTKPVNPHILFSKVNTFLELYQQRSHPFAEREELEEEIRRLEQEVESLRKQLK